ncbi:MAG: glycosyltransferase [Planctomycetes bacterium]|nr:glycosyltransferase [Nannocystis sp.]MBA3546999.1 glycosyltransferase [Nannocystis sp.]MBA3845028.1 glycosyltransferase [Planctomycetota bacterium]
MPPLDPPLLTLIAPVLDEAASLPGFLDHLHRLAHHSPVLVVDGGSRDSSAEVAARHPMAPRVVSIRGGRHAQLNAALALADTDYVVCLPIDARVAQGSLGRLERILRRERPVAGCLRRHASRRTWPHRWLDGWGCVRARWTGGGYMDQAPFYHRRMALAVGGFHAVGPYDTADLALRLGRFGRFRVADAAIAISCRSYGRVGFVRLTLAHQRLRVRWLTTRLEISKPDGRTSQTATAPAPIAATP